MTARFAAAKDDQAEPGAGRGSLASASPQGWVPSRLVLASTSPRRRRILDHLGFSCTSADVEIDETPLRDEAPEALAERLARAKARAGASLYPGTLCIGADTVVALGGTTLRKPTDAATARAMLLQLGGREHQVLSAVAVAHLAADSGQTRIWHRLDVARVHMRDYTDDEIGAYVASGDPLDKAGAYAIQHAGFRPVERLEGCFLTVMGLPLPALCGLLDEVGVSRPALTAEGLEAVCPNCSDLGLLLD